MKKINSKNVEEIIGIIPEIMDYMPQYIKDNPENIKYLKMFL